MDLRTPLNFFDRDAVVVARDLIGVELLLNGVGGIIVEPRLTHGTILHLTVIGAQRAGTLRCSVLRVSFTSNAVCRPGNAVLLRALEPTSGVDSMAERRSVSSVTLLCSGPGRLTQALGINPALNGLSLLQPPFSLRFSDRPCEVASGSRIGISRELDV
jgi:DNA-3-methyladenine glycosylase